MSDGNRTMIYPASLLVVLVLINFVNYFDRSLIGIMAEAIMQDLGLSDGELALSTGLAFTITYALLAIPVARIADRGFQKRVIMISIALWSCMTFLIGSVHNLWQLAASRMGVAIGEAGILPASHSLISAEFRAARMALIIGVLWIGGFLGAAAAPVIGGTMVDTLGWRDSFMLVGAASLMLLPIAFFILRQPKAFEAIDTESVSNEPPDSWLSVARRLFANQTFTLLWCGSALMMAGPQANILYAGPFLIRTFGLSSSEAGAYLAVASAAPMIGGTLLGGWIFDRIRRRSLALALVNSGACVLLGGLVVIWGWFSGNALTATVCLAVANTLFGFMTAPGYATTQILAPANMKSTAAAIFNMGMSLVGASIGPLVAGYLSDAVSPSTGVRSLSYGLTAAAVLTLAGAVLVMASGFSASREIRHGERSPV